jgi:four helix bundle protein
MAAKEDMRQLIRASGSVAANYIEANESISKKDFVHRIKICRKEAKESGLWLRLLQSQKPERNQSLAELVQESSELTRIFGAIVEKSK